MTPGVGQLAIFVLVLVLLYGVVPFYRWERQQQARRAVIETFYGIYSPEEMLLRRLAPAFSAMAEGVARVMERYAAGIAQATAALAQFIDAYNQPPKGDTDGD